jgi:LysR family transcriptional regulator, glycine cleavage system transcriptional activator
MSPTLARLPPLTSLRAFVATARHLSFTRAADELHVTSAAIGQQIRLLEDYIGEALFLRNRGQLELTDTGQTLMPGLTDAFDRVLETMARLTVGGDVAPIRVSVAPSFASKWLVPRLAALRKRAPDLEVLVDASVKLADPSRDETDCVIRYGLGAYPGLAVDKPCWVFPFCMKTGRSATRPARIGRPGCAPMGSTCALVSRACGSTRHRW